MDDEYIFLFAQWGIFTTEQCRIILKKFGSFKAAWKGLSFDSMKELNFRADKIRRVLEVRERISFEDTMNLVRRFDVKVYYVDEADFPETLRNIKIPPPFIFVRGNLPSFHKAMAVVGTRAHSDYGMNVTKRFTADLVRNGFVIVSGLAIGIDSIAHRAALEWNGSTVAVLGSGVDIISPASNHQLGERIIKSGGAILSTYPLGTKAERHHFPQRNVIISGLSQGTLVTEGGPRSGALITAREAHEQGREVFAVPNDISKPALSGTNKIIRKSEAKLVENIEHILEDFQMRADLMHRVIELDGDESELMHFLTRGGKTMDELIEETKFSYQDLCHLVLKLQLKNAIAEQDNRYVIL